MTTEQEETVESWDVIEPDKLYRVEYIEDGEQYIDLMESHGNEIVGLNYSFWRHDKNVRIVSATEVVCVPLKLWEETNNN